MQVLNAVVAAAVSVAKICHRGALEMKRMVMESHHDPLLPMLIELKTPEAKLHHICRQHQNIK